MLLAQLYPKFRSTHLLLGELGELGGGVDSSYEYYTVCAIPGTVINQVNVPIVWWVGPLVIKVGVIKSEN